MSILLRAVISDQWSVASAKQGGMEDGKDGRLSESQITRINGFHGTRIVGGPVRLETASTVWAASKEE